MRVLCRDDKECKNYFVMEVHSAHYNERINGLLFNPVFPFGDFCIPDMDADLCNVLIGRLYSEGLCDLRDYGSIQLYSDTVSDDDELPFK